MQDYLEIIGDAVEDMRKEEIQAHEYVTIKKSEFIDEYKYLCALIDKLNDKTATYREVEMYLGDLENRMGKYI